jgi:hypothetical protein
MAMLVLCAVVLISLTHTDDPYCQCRRPETKRSYAEHEQTISPRTSSRATLSSRSKSSRREAMSSGSTRCPSFSQRACVWYVRRPASCVQYSPLTISGLGDRTQSPRPRHRRDNLWSEPPHLFHLPGDGLPPAWTLGHLRLRLPLHCRCGFLCRAARSVRSHRAQAPRRARQMGEPRRGHVLVDMRESITPL